MKFFNFTIYKFLIYVLFLLGSYHTEAQKTVYIPSFITNTGMDLNDNNSQWSYRRSIETDDLVVFWEPGFGNDPAIAPNPFRIDMESLIATSEKSFSFFVDSLKFAIKGS